MKTNTLFYSKILYTDYQTANLANNRLAKVTQRNGQSRLQAIILGYLYQKVLGINEDNDIHYGDTGKPYFCKDGLFLSASHSEDYVAVIVADQPVGIDIEVMKQDFPIEIAKHYFLKEEYQEILAAPSPNTFYRIWTKREAISKATGKGFQMSNTEWQQENERWSVSYQTIGQVMFAVASPNKCQLSFKKINFNKKGEFI